MPKNLMKYINTAIVILIVMYAVNKIDFLKNLIYGKPAQTGSSV